MAVSGYAGGDASQVSPEPILVTAAVLVEGDRVLIAQRPPGAHMELLWEFPGGTVRPGERLQDCLRREIKEELGIDVEVGELWAQVRHDYPDKSVDLHFFLCRRVGTMGDRSEPTPIGCAAVRWVKIEELEDYQFPPADNGVLDRLRAEFGR